MNQLLLMIIPCDPT